MDRGRGRIGGVNLASPLTTGALWRDALSLGAGQVSSGSLVLLNGDATTQVDAYTFTALAGSNLRPGSSAPAPLTMRNGGTTALGYRLADTTVRIDHLARPADARFDRVTGERVQHRRRRAPRHRGHQRHVRRTAGGGDHRRPAPVGAVGHRDPVRPGHRGRLRAAVGRRHQRLGPLHLRGGAGMTAHRRATTPPCGGRGRSAAGWSCSWSPRFVAATVAVPGWPAARVHGDLGLHAAQPSPGALIVIRPADPVALGIGDVITYQAVSGRPAVITHRIIGFSFAASGEITSAPGATPTARQTRTRYARCRSTCTARTGSASAVPLASPRVRGE